MKKYKFFWDGIYSNWHKSSFIIVKHPIPVIELNSLQFNCVEQYMMFCKAVTFNDIEIAENILTESNPRKQKALGRLVKNFDSKKWDEVKYNLVKVGVLAKFVQNEDLKQQLLSEDCDLFVEASPFDRVWGIGYDEHDAHVVDEKHWGENLLGKIITEVRDELKSSQYENK